jgi:glycosyltransferase involved in cell wall biosynthesis
VFDSDSHLVRWKTARRWRADVSRGYDLFVNLTHQMPPFSHARRSVLFVLFPFLRREGWPWCDAPSHPTSVWQRRVRRAYFDAEWRRRMAGYQVRLSISQYTRHWTQRWWGIDTHVVYPPVETSFPQEAKTSAIVSLGRFAPTGTKQQLDLVNVARATLTPDGPWQYWSIGTAGDEPEDREYVQTVQARSNGLPVSLLTNLGRDELKQHLARARIFWHASGLGTVEEARPEASEHFGIAVVEAMAAGCVPLVARRGAMPEIVEDGTSGFLCDSFDDMARYTRVLLEQPERLASMAAQARIRAEFFDRASFERRFDEALRRIGHWSDLSRG